MATESVGIREFRDKLATYLLTADKPLAITRHGETVGYYIPRKREVSAAERKALDAAHARLQAVMAAKNITEEDIIADLKLLKEERRKISKSRK
jgi:PHD/YefM family antitoxin component YafN of YafNO toxin-antitoxin module